MSDVREHFNPAFFEDVGRDFRDTIAAAGLSIVASDRLERLLGDAGRWRTYCVTGSLPDGELHLSSRADLAPLDPVGPGAVRYGWPIHTNAAGLLTVALYAVLDLLAGGEQVEELACEYVVQSCAQGPWESVGGFGGLAEARRNEQIYGAAEPERAHRVVRRWTMQVVLPDVGGDR